MHDDYTADAELYDVVYADYDDDIAFYVSEAQRAHGPCLELGAGTGRTLLPVAEAGVTVTGIELSAAMVALAQRKLRRATAAVQARVALHAADMRTFQLDERFALIYIPFRAFLHLTQVGDQLEALENIRRHLLPGGRLALNFFEPSLPYIAANLDADAGTLRRTGEEFVDPRTGHQLVEWATTHYQPLSQHLDQYFIYDELGKDGRVIKRFYRRVFLRYIHRWEFEHLLARTGFEVEALYGSFDRGPILHHGGELIWVARATAAR